MGKIVIFYEICFTPDSNIFIHMLKKTDFCEVFLSQRNVTNNVKTEQKQFITHTYKLKQNQIITDTSQQDDRHFSNTCSRKNTTHFHTHPVEEASLRNY